MSLTNLNTYGVFPYSLTNLQVINTSDGGSLPVSGVDPVEVTLTSTNQQVSLYESAPDLIDFETFDKSLKVKNINASSGTIGYLASNTGYIGYVNANNIYASTSIYSNSSLNAPNAFITCNGIDSIGSNPIRGAYFTGGYITVATGTFTSGVTTNNLNVSGTAVINSISISGANIPFITFTTATGTNSLYCPMMSGYQGYFDQGYFNRINSSTPGRIESNQFQAYSYVYSPSYYVSNSYINSTNLNNLELCSNTDFIYLRQGSSQASGQVVVDPTISKITCDSIDLSNITWVVATGSNAYLTNVQSTNFTATNAAITNLTSTTMTGTTIWATNAAITNLTSTTMTGNNAYLTNVQSTNFTATNAAITNLTSTTMTGTTIWATNRRQNGTLWNQTSTASDRLNWQWNGTDYMVLENQNSGLLTVQNGFFKNQIAINDQVGYSWVNSSYALDARAGPCRIANGTADKTSLLEFGSTGPISNRMGYIYTDSASNYMEIANQGNGIMYLTTNNSAKLLLYPDGQLVQNNCSSNGNFAMFLNNAGSSASTSYGLLIDQNSSSLALAIRDRSGVYRHYFSGNTVFIFGATASNANGSLQGMSWNDVWNPTHLSCGYYGYAQATTQPDINLTLDKQTAISTTVQPYMKIGTYEFRSGGKYYHLIGAGYANKQFDVNSPLYFGGWSPTDSGRTRTDFVAMTRNVTSDTIPSERFRVNSSNNGGSTIFCLPQTSYVGWTGSNAIDGISNIGSDGLKVVFPNSLPVGYESTTNPHAISISNAISTPSQVLNMGCTTGYAYVQSLGNSNYNLNIQPVSADNTETQIHNKGATITGTNAGMIFRQTYLSPRETSTVMVYSQKGSATSNQGVWIYGVGYYNSDTFAANTADQDIYFTGAARAQFNQPNTNPGNFSNVDVPVAGLYKFQISAYWTHNVNFGYDYAEVIMDVRLNGTVITKQQGTFNPGKASLSCYVIRLCSKDDTFGAFIQTGECLLTDFQLTWSCELIQ
jgi:hypothetical protein